MYNGQNHQDMNVGGLLFFVVVLIGMVIGSLIFPPLWGLTGLMAGVVVIFSLMMIV